MAGGPPINPQMLMGLLGGGGGAPGGAGGGPAMPPGGAPGGAMPPGGGGLAGLLGGAGGGGGGAMIAQVLQQLMQNPAAIRGMMNAISGQSPTAGIPLPPSQGGPMPGGPAVSPIPPTQGPQGEPPPPPGQAGPPPAADGGDGAEAMAQDQIDNAGNTWDGTDAPTKGDIARLVENPSPSVIKSFDEQFGDGMAEKYLQDQGVASDQGDAEDKADQGADESDEKDGY